MGMVPQAIQDPILAQHATRAQRVVEKHDHGGRRVGRTATGEDEPSPRQGEEHDKRHHRNNENERCPAAGMPGAVCLDCLHREGIATLICVDGLVLGTVVFKDAPNILEKRDEPDIADKDDHLHHAVDQVEQNPRPLDVFQKIVA